MALERGIATTHAALRLGQLPTADAAEAAGRTPSAARAATGVVPTRETNAGAAAEHGPGHCQCGW